MKSRTFGTPGLTEENRVYFLKTLSDSRKIRSRMIDCFEKASSPSLDEEEKTRLLNFIIVGAGPTNVEYAGELSQFIKDDLVRWFPELAKKAKISIVEVADVLMPSYAKDIQDYAAEEFKKDGINLLFKTSVKEIRRNSKDQSEVELSDGSV